MKPRFRIVWGGTVNVYHWDYELAPIYSDFRTFDTHYIFKYK